ncbi:MAG: elongation factor G [Pseudomonadota bacterium]
MRAVIVIGPSQSGKTTLVAALSGLEGARPQSRAMMGDARITSFEFMGDRWAAMDIPGGQDNLSQLGPALAASDAAVLCAPAEVSAAVLSAPYLRLLEESKIPTFLFINRIDMASDRVADVVASLQEYSEHGIVLRQVPMRSGEEIVGAIDLISERAWRYREDDRSALVELPENMLPREQEARASLLESLADFDDALLEQIIEDKSPVSEEVYNIATRALQHHDLIPALLGSASHGNGILRLMKSLRHEVPGTDALRERLGLSSDAMAVSCMADHVKHLGKSVLIRALGDGIAPGNRLGGATIGGLNGVKANAAVPSIAPGEFALTIKSDHISLGHIYGADGGKALPDWAGTRPHALRRLIQPASERDESKLASALAHLVEIDPGLTLTHDEVTGLHEIGLQGPQHLRRLTDKLLEGFGLEVECREVPTALRETIQRNVNMHHRHRKQSGGAGQFADVVIDVTKRPSGSGFEFNETVKGGAVPRNYIPAVETGARDALACGPAGYPVVDIGVILRDGKSHSVDSSDFAFRTAGQNAVKQALSEAGTTVLQPILNVEVHVPSIFAGDLVQLASGLKGQVQGFEQDPSAAGWDIFRLWLPMAGQEELSRNLSSVTRGTAWFTSALDYYEEVREPSVAHA